MTVVHCKRQPFMHYIGRPGPLGNPFSHLGDSAAYFKVPTREEAISEFDRWIKTQPMLLRSIMDLPEDVVLGCWCKPKSCHGDVIVEIWNKLHGKNNA